MKTILVIRSSAMGDVAMTAPVLRALKDRYGDELRLVMLTRSFYEPFFDGLSIEIYNIDLDGVHRGIRGIIALFRELTARYDFDAVIDLNHKLFSRLLKRLFSMRRVPTYHIDKGRQEKKELTRPKNKTLRQLRSSIERYADVFRAAGYEIEVPNTLPPRSTREIPAFAGVKTSPWIGIAPFAKHEGKILPIKTIRSVIELIAEQIPEARIFIFGGGRAEQMVADSIVAWYPSCTSTIGRTKLREEIDLIANLDVMVSMDSSAMHMGSLVGTPIVSVWGATHPAAGFLGIGQSQDDVVSVEMECRPCSVYGHKPCLRGDYACMHRITAEMIVERIKSRVGDR